MNGSDILNVVEYEYYVTGVHLTFRRSDIGLLSSGFFFPTALFAVFSILALLIKITEISDRITMLLTICLISMTIYVSVQAPPNRGLSFIEIWIIGMLIPTILAILESSWILLKLRSMKKDQNSMTSDVTEENETKLRLYDFIMAVSLTVYFCLFQTVYWCTALI